MTFKDFRQSESARNKGVVTEGRNVARDHEMLIRQALSEGKTIPPEVLAETAYVLTSVYQVSRDIVVDNLIALIQKENISIFALDKGLVLQALLLCRSSGRISFADAMVWAAAQSAGSKVVYSLDERFPEYGLEVRGRL